MNSTCLAFVKRVLSTLGAAGTARVLEVGACDYNGSARATFAGLQVDRYVGVDLIERSGEDLVCSVHDLHAQFNPGSFDLVVAMELMEHVDDWRSAIRQLKEVTREGGATILSTRSRGFPYHGFPFDFWRFELEDCRRIFADWDIDPEPGVLLKARQAGRPSADLSGIALYSILCGRRTLDHTPVDVDRVARMQEWRRGLMDAPLGRWLQVLYWQFWRRPLRKLEKAVRRSSRGEAEGSRP
jgi:SAM-dependent methyltransferase